MPSFNRFGQWCSGEIGMGVYHGSIHEEGKLLWDKAGSARWLGLRTLCAGYWKDGVPRVRGFDKDSDMEFDVSMEAFNKLITSKRGHWAGFSTLFGVKDSQKRHFPNSYIENDSMGPDGSYCIKTEYQSSGGWDLLFPNDERIGITNGDMSQITNFGDGHVVWTNAEGTESFSTEIELFNYNPLIFPIWKPKMFFIDGKFWQLYGCPLGCFFHPVDSTIGYKIGGPGNYFGLDVYVMGNEAEVIWAVNEGEVLSDIRSLIIDLAVHNRTELKSIKPIPTPIPVPVPVPVPKEINLELEKLLRNRLEVVRMIRHDLFGISDNTPLNNPVKALQLTRAVATALKAEGWGMVLAKKGSDNNVNGYNADNIALRDGEHVDVVEDAEGKGFAAWLPARHRNDWEQSWNDEVAKRWEALDDETPKPLPVPVPVPIPVPVPHECPPCEREHVREYPQHAELKGIFDNYMGQLHGRDMTGPEQQLFHLAYIYFVEHADVERIDDQIRTWKI